MSHVMECDTDEELVEIELGGWLGIEFPYLYMFACVCCTVMDLMQSNIFVGKNEQVPNDFQINIYPHQTSDFADLTRQI